MSRSTQITIDDIDDTESSPRTRGFVPLDKDGPVERALGWVSNKAFGKVIDPLRVYFHHRGMLASNLALEATASRWTKLPPTLNALAILAVSREIGCSWCMDFGYWEFYKRGVAPEKIRAIAEWRTSAVYSPLERAVIEYVIAVTATPCAATQELVDALRPELDDAQIVELAGLVALENFRSRVNAGLGLRSQGFKENCEIPAGEKGRE